MSWIATVYLTAI